MTRSQVIGHRLLFLITFAKLVVYWVGFESREVGGASLCRDMKLNSVVFVWWFKFVTVSRLCRAKSWNCNRLMFKWWIICWALLCSALIGRLQTLICQITASCASSVRIINSTGFYSRQKTTFEKNPWHSEFKEQGKQDSYMKLKFFGSICILVKKNKKKKPWSSRTGAVVSVTSTTGLTKTHLTSFCEKPRQTVGALTLHESHWLIVKRRSRH